MVKRSIRNREAFMNGSSEIVTVAKLIFRTVEA